MSKPNGVPNKVLWFKKNSGSSNRFVTISLTDEVKEMLLNGLTPIEDKPQLGLFLMTKFPLEEEGGNKFAYYPVRMLYRSEAERILNSIIHGRFLPSYEQMEYMYNNIEDLVGCPIDWYLKPQMSTEALISTVDNFLDETTLSKVSPTQLLETIGLVLACRELFPKDSVEWAKYLNIAMDLGDRILKLMKKDTEVTLEVEDYL